MTTLNEVTQSQFDTAEATLISLVRAAYPMLDLRRGTVLRDLLIRPAASVFAYNTDNLNELQTRMSLTNLTGDSVPVAWVNAILANFGVQSDPGTLAGGPVKIIVSGSRVYSIAAGFAFTSVDGLVFVTAHKYTVKEDAVVENGETELVPIGDGTYYFIINLVASAVGAQYNIAQGTVVEPNTTLIGIVTGEAYTAFSGGTDAETVTQVIARLPAAVSYQALESRTSIEAKLRTVYPNMKALGVQGYGDAAQLRDKHNPMGFAIGSRVDLYPRMFTSPSIVTLAKTGTLVGPNTYQFTINRNDAPGFYLIRSIAEPDVAVNPLALFGQVPVVGSYAYTEVRSADGLNSTFHDIDPENSMIETAYTVYQKSVVTVTGVAQTGNTHDFKVEVIVDPSLSDIQSYVDDPDIRNLEGDYLVHCPLICLIALKAKVIYNARTPIDLSKIQLDLFNYINDRNFVGKLSRSELVSIMMADGATRVDMSESGMVLQGLIRDASGVLHRLQGDILDITQIEAAPALLVADTAVFSTELGSIVLEAQSE